MPLWFSTPSRTFERDPLIPDTKLIWPGFAVKPQDLTHAWISLDSLFSHASKTAVSTGMIGIVLESDLDLKLAVTARSFFSTLNIKDQSWRARGSAISLHFIEDWIWVELRFYFLYSLDYSMLIEMNKKSSGRKILRKIRAQKTKNPDSAAVKLV